jgi:hypothetical protein
MQNQVVELVIPEHANKMGGGKEKFSISGSKIYILN